MSRLEREEEVGGKGRRVRRGNGSANHTRVGMRWLNLIQWVMCLGSQRLLMEIGTLWPFEMHTITVGSALSNHRACLCVRVCHSDGNEEMLHHAPGGARWKCVFSSFAIIVCGWKYLSGKEQNEMTLKLSRYCCYCAGAKRSLQGWVREGPVQPRIRTSHQTVLTYCWSGPVKWFY